MSGRSGRGRPWRGWRLVGAGLLVVGVLLPLLLRVAWEGRAELAAADAAAVQGRVDLESVHLGRAARWRAPFVGHDEAALARLMALGEAAEADDPGSQTALMAHREARAALLATRAWGPADAALLGAVNGKIAAAMAAQERAFGTDLSRRGEPEAHHRALLEAGERGEPPWAPLAGLALVAAVLGLLRGLPVGGGVRRRALVIGGATALVLAVAAWWLRPG